MRLGYQVSPLLPAVVSDWHKRLEVVRDLQITFWDCLILPFGDQLDCLALVDATPILIVEKSWLDERIEYKEFETDSIYKTLEQHIIEYVNAYRQRPSVVLVGWDIHKQFIGEALLYHEDFRYMRNGQIHHIQGVHIVLMLNMNGFLLLSEDDVKNM